jgi:hypothetical protein
MRSIPSLARRMRGGLVPCVLASALGACSNPTPPADQPPAPQASATPAAQRGALEEVIQAPQDKARAVEPAVMEAAKQQDQAIDAQSQ